MFIKFDLPEPIILVVQSFLTSKEAARTTILSKSWRSAWLTRPSLDFDHTDFCGSNYGYHEVNPKFLEFMEKTLERYENSNLKIDSFRLSTFYLRFKATIITVTKLVRRALKLGPTRLVFDFVDSDFDIPDEVFRHENLVSLTAKRCGINLLNREEVRCSKLQFLSLEDVQIKSRDMIFCIISSCPLIEKLSLSNVKVDDGGGLYVDGGMQTTNINIRHRLTSLVLENVNFDTLFLVDLSSELPSLKDLTLHINRDLTRPIENIRKEIIISSSTLERLDIRTGHGGGRFARLTVHRVKLDVPSLRKLTFDCTSIPKLSLTSNSRGWEESYISVTRSKSLSASWFYKLSHFLNKLRLSRVFLSLHVNSRTTFDYEGDEIRGPPTPEIEDLDIYLEDLPTQSCHVLFDGLFRICRPKMITQYYHDYLIGFPEEKNVRFLGKILLNAMDTKVSMSYQFMYGLNDLKEARAQVFDEDFNKWRDEEPLHDALSNYNGSYKNPTPDYNDSYYNPTGEAFRHQKLRFLLYWKL